MGRDIEGIYKLEAEGSEISYVINVRTLVVTSELSDLTQDTAVLKEAISYMQIG